MFAATDADGSRDGLASPDEFGKPTGLCVELDHVLSMCDAQTNCIKVFATLHKTAAFLDVVGKLSPSTRIMQSTRLRVVPHLSSGIVERAKRARARESHPTRERREAVGRENPIADCQQKQELSKRYRIYSIKRPTSN